MLYGIGRVDASGRVASREITEALDWRPGERVDVVITACAVVIRTCPEGLVRVPRRPCVIIPAPARHRRGIEAGDLVLLAAAPEHGLVIVHTLSELDDMLSAYHAARSPARTA